MEHHVEDDLGCSTRRVRGKHGRKPTNTTSTENSLAAGGKPRPVHEPALSRELHSCQSYQSVQLYQSHQGANEREPPPSEYDDHTGDTCGSMDMGRTRGTDEVPDHQSEDRTSESDAVRHTVSISEGFADGDDYLWYTAVVGLYRLRQTNAFLRYTGLPTEVRLRMYVQQYR